MASFSTVKTADGKGNNPYPPAAPFDDRMLKVSDIHTIRYV